MKKSTFFCVFVMMFTLFVLTGPVSAESQILEVGPGYPYATIQAAVDEASQGSQILVYPDPDWYLESVPVSKNNLRIIAQGDGVIVEPSDTAGFLVNADHVTIQGFEIRYAIYCAPAVVLEGSHNNIAQNRFLVSASSECMNPIAFLIDDPDGGSNFNTIEGNYIKADQGIQIGAKNPGTKNKGNIIKDNEINAGMFGLNVYNAVGINVYNGEGFTISGNQLEVDYGSCITAYAGEGMHLGQHRIRDNTLISCGYGYRFGLGIGLYAESNASMTNNHVISNTISRATVSGIILSADEGAAVNDNLIKGNLVYKVNEPRGEGITLKAGADHNTIINNESQTNQVGISVAGDYNLIASNVIYNNTVHVLDVGVGNRWRNNDISDQ